MADTVDVFARLALLAVTYDNVGATLSADQEGFPPSGYRGYHARIRLGSGELTWSRTCHAVMNWGIHHKAQIEVRTQYASFSPLAEGDDVVLRLRLGPFGVSAPVRVISVMYEENTRGFSYGTLPGHPERGEEAFIVRHQDDDSVWLELRSFSRPSNLFWKLASPAGRVVQSLISQRYLNALLSD